MPSESREPGSDTVPTRIGVRSIGGKASVPWVRIVLGELLLVNGDDVRVLVEDDEAGRAGEMKDQIGHVLDG